MNEGPKKLVDTYMKAQLIYYVITFLGFLDPPSPHMHVLVLILSKNWHFPDTSLSHVIYQLPLRHVKSKHTNFT